MEKNTSLFIRPLEFKPHHFVLSCFAEFYWALFCFLLGNHFEREKIKYLLVILIKYKI